MPLSPASKPFHVLSMSGASDVVAAIYDRIEAGSIQPNWIHLRPRADALLACAEMFWIAAASAALICWPDCSVEMIVPMFNAI